MTTINDIPDDVLGIILSKITSPIILLGTCKRWADIANSNSLDAVWCDDDAYDDVIDWARDGGSRCDAHYYGREFEVSYRDSDNVFNIMFNGINVDIEMCSLRTYMLLHMIIDETMVYDRRWTNARSPANVNIVKHVISFISCIFGHKVQYVNPEPFDPMSTIRREIIEGDRHKN